MLTECEARFNKAIELKRVQEVERLIEQMSSLYYSAYRRNPDYWINQYHWVCSRLHEANN